MLDDVQAAPIDKLPVDERWITVPADVGDVRVRIVRPAGRRRDAAGDPLHARRRLGARQRRHARPARPRARRRRRRRRRVRRVRPLARGALPGRDRAGLRDRPVDRARGRRQRARPEPHRRRRRLGRRQHDRGADADGAASAATCASCTSRCTTRSPTPRMDTGSYEQFAEGYFLTAKAMAWFWDAYLPDVERRSEPYASPLRASDEQLAGLPPALRDRRRGRRAARRGRGLRARACARPASRSPPSATTASRTTS